MPSDSVETPIHVRYDDLDTMEHVHNSVYLSYLEIGRIDFMNRYLRNLLPDGTGLLIARIEIDYKNSIFINDHIVCRTALLSVGNTSMTMQGEIAKDDGTVCASAKTVAVLVNRKREKIRIPDSVRLLLH